ncbi:MULTISPECIES: UDP-N-acetylmuramate dehydrogenase [Micromonospora]|uniref:UDP-N-acetylenolpyruvoylglucosamine reductase n=1 Tax=Micromonospora sicca TaxID=2202420 RepID=A0A317DD39_9ACTN|nr:MULTISPECIES: UDP-N-acetylmuramate dehydrogenase [unclassified Micromonospora]MBM0226920.1 UDP-N-acetylmuramate dehydrogenase [Micromonospora sp. ATA51]PWR11666.1 UDP-N-acetylenolpyruvoylglucosamine reductase [Micromonospora sp. 4G51]
MTITFADLTTMRVGGPVGRLYVPETTSQVIELLHETTSDGDQLLVMGGGSNLVVGDIGWHGTVIKMASAEFHIDGELVTAAAGVEWDDVVKASVHEGLSGLEALSGIPGLVGGTPVQNVGAFGTVTSDVLESLSVYDRHTGLLERWTPERCGFGSHRQSVFKHSDRWVVVQVTFRLRRSNQSRPIEYVELARKLGIAVGGTAAPADVREAVLALRRSRAMVLDPENHDTWSVGSFFINPVLAEVPARAAECPRYFDVKGTKLPAAWLIEHAGFPRGYGHEWGNGTVALSSRHALAVTNRGGATASDVMKFAAHIRDGVEARFGIRLGPECDLVNCSF